MLIVRRRKWSKFGKYIGRHVIFEDGSKTTELQHRWVYEQHIGRKLLSNEHVHHKDENGYNNDLSNLELLTASAHAKHHADSHPAETKQCICPQCSVTFTIKLRLIRHNQIKQGKAGPFCGKSCAGKWSATNGKPRAPGTRAGRQPALSREDAESVLRMLADGKNKSEISRVFGVSRPVVLAIARGNYTTLRQ